MPPPTEPTAVVPDPDLVTRLLRDQAPHLADLPVRASPASGSSNWVFRLGDALAVRLPRDDGYVLDLRTEVRWLPHLTPRLACPVPEVVAVGAAGHAFPRPWAVLSWLPGELPSRSTRPSRTGSPRRSAPSFGASTRSTPPTRTASSTGGTGAASPSPTRSTTGPHRAATALADLLTRLPSARPGGGCAASRRPRRPPAGCTPTCPPRTSWWTTHGRLVGVIDFGGLGVGDRSVDLLYAWSLLDAPARDTLRIASGADDATWSRARAWAFVGPGLLTVAGYRRSMPARTERLTAMVEAVAAEVGVRLR